MNIFNNMWGKCCKGKHKKVSAVLEITDQQRARQVRPADLVQRHAELDPLQLAVVLGQVLGTGTGRHHCPHVTDPVVDVRHDGPPPTHLGPLV